MKEEVVHVHRMRCTDDLCYDHMFLCMHELYYKDVGVCSCTEESDECVWWEVPQLH